MLNCLLKPRTVKLLKKTTAIQVKTNSPKRIGKNSQIKPKQEKYTDISKWHNIFQDFKTLKQNIQGQLPVNSNSSQKPV